MDGAELDFELVVDTLTTAELFGRLHPLSVHLPIAATILLLVYEVAARFGVKGVVQSMKLHIAIALGSYLPAIATGMMRMQEYTDDDAIRQALVHRDAMIGALALLSMLCWWRWLTPHRVTWWYLAGLAAAIAFMGFGADLGGLLVFGEDYFR